jgi:chromosome segregation ATPase
MYEECIETYEREAAEKDTRICTLAKELTEANARISLLECRIEELASELEGERAINANLTMTTTDLQDKLYSARANAAGYDDVIAILRREAESYQVRLAAADNGAGSSALKERELVELLDKAKESLAREKKRATEALEEKDTTIALLDRELAEKFNEIYTIQCASKETNEQLSKMTGMYNAETLRADALDEKIRKLNQFTTDAVSAKAIADDVKNVSLMKRLEDLTASNEQYKSLVNSYDDRIKIMSQRLILSDQILSTKLVQIENLRRELVEATAKSRVVVADRMSTSDEVSVLRAKLDDVQSMSTVWKAQANGMIVQLTNNLKEKESSIKALTDKLNVELLHQKDEPSGSREKSLEDQIAKLKLVLEESQVKAKERIKRKNQSLMEMQDTVAALTAEMKDLKHEKNQLMTRLTDDIQWREDDYKISERHLRQTEDRLSKEHIADVKAIEDEMNQTIQKLETEIKTLRNKGENGRSPVGISTANDYSKVLEMEKSLRRSKEKEVSLINENMKMKQKIQDMLDQKAKETPPMTSVMLNEEDQDDGNEKLNSARKTLPAYYTERQRQGVIHFVGNAWKKIFRRK